MERRTVISISMAILVAACIGPTYAAQAKKYQVIRMEDVRPMDQYLFAAVREGKVAEVRRLLGKGADPNANEANGGRPLLSLGGTPTQKLAMAKLLVGKGGHVSYRQPDQGWTPLIMAILGGQDCEPLVRYFLAKGADPKASLTDGQYPLHFGVRSGSVQIVKELLARGASLTARTQSLPSFRSAAEFNNGFEESLQEKDRKEELDRAFEPNFKFSGITPAFELAYQFHPEMAEFLHSRGVNFKATDDNGWTILHHAVKNGAFDAVQWLLKIGLNPNAPSKAGYRPLHVAMRVGLSVPDVKTVSLLLHASADPSLRTNDGKTPLDELRSDVAWRLRSTDPAIANAAEAVRDYLAMANHVAKLLDPRAEPIVAPPPFKDQYGKRYQPIEFGNNLVAQRAVRVEGGKAILRLMFDQPRRSQVLTIQSVMLQDYEPLESGPFRISLEKGRPGVLEIAFPEAAASGGAVNAMYSDGQNGGGQFAEGAQIEPTFEEGATITSTNDVPGRTMLVRLDKVTIAGKPAPKLSGRLLRIEPGHTVSTGIPQPTPKARVVLSYSVNLVPNKKWSHETISLP